MITSGQWLRATVMESWALHRLPLRIPRIDLHYLLVCLLDRLLDLPAFDQDAVQHMADDVSGKHLA